MATKTIFNILDKVYLVLNVDAVNDLLDGRIYRFKKPVNDVKKNVVLSPLPIRDRINVDLQDGILFINVYAQNLENGTPDEATLNSITEAIIPLIEAAWSGSLEYFNFKIIEQSLFDDTDGSGRNTNQLSYVSLRCEYFIEST